MRPSPSARSLSIARRRQCLSIPSRSLLASRPYSDVTPAESTSSSAASSSSSQPAWPRPLPEGKLPAYDVALEYIRSRDAQLSERRKAVEDGRIAVDEGAHPTGNLKGADRFDVRIHDPEVRWKWEQGLADPEDASSKYLELEKFELGGGLDLHTQRITQMHVVPDVTMLQSGLVVDFGFRFPAPPPPPAPKPDEWGWVKEVRPYETRDPKDEGRVLCGSKLTVKESLVQPELHIRHFGHDHKGGHDKKRYTVLLLDADVPDPKNFSFTQKILWMVPNIELSPSTRIFPSPDFPVSKTAKNVSQLPPALIPYLPPHPHQGSGDHRYTFLLLRHNGPITFGELDAPGVVAVPKRDEFNFRHWSWALSHRQDLLSADVLHPKNGKQRNINMTVAGCSFFRSSYDEVVCPKIWQQLIREPEVKFNIPGRTTNREYLTPRGVNKVKDWNLQQGLIGPGAPTRGTAPPPKNKFISAQRAAFGFKDEVETAAEEDVQEEAVFDAPPEMVEEDAEGQEGEQPEDGRDGKQAR